MLLKHGENGFIELYGNTSILLVVSLQYHIPFPAFMMETHLNVKKKFYLDK